MTSDALRRAMRKLAATVSIVTTVNEGGWHGMAVTSFTSVSLSPPSILVCINSNSEFFRHVSAARKFCVNVLGDMHEEQCHVFGGSARRAERFAVGDWRVVGGLPALANAQAVLSCRTFKEVECGTHITIFASVASISLQESDAGPLVYMDGKVRQLDLGGLKSFRSQTNNGVPHYG